MPVVSKQDRETHTPALLLWNEALSFIRAAYQLAELKYRTPQLHLATHGTELALKAHLRAKKYTLKRLTQIGHSLTDALAECNGTGMEAPPAYVLRMLKFLSEAHEDHEFRYAHLKRPPHMDRQDWIVPATWALRSAIPAVAKDEAGKKTSDIPAIENAMRRHLTRSRFPNAGARANVGAV